MGVGWGEPSRNCIADSTHAPQNVNGWGAARKVPLVYPFLVLPSSLVLRLEGGGRGGDGERAENVGGEGQGRGEGVKQGPPPRPEEVKAPGEPAHPLAPHVR